MCKVTPISGKNDNNSRFLQVFLIFGQRLGSMVVALRWRRLAASSRLAYWVYGAYWAYSAHWAYRCRYGMRWRRVVARVMAV